MNHTCQHYRFIEKVPPKRDLTFTFFSDGRLIIENNETGELITPSQLRSDSKEFYVKHRISFIKNRLQQAKERFA
ncbi:hypothetical protein J40TS1_05100 [Paenibacillus montaniterrae]|uniref:Uncharacterized protein n=1 Tax=Paenibacillus montaniterrae TaxID=429341 RepID=A0A919YQ06_9BACL|nr:hypothetical protein [Paenibacillus montaniterrae]GIP14868.1 hypothetical protein J40TS1_05100 [Paenibacillus montaniterrae]